MMLIAVAILFPILFRSTTLGGIPGSLTLAWDPSTDPTVVGYRLYDGLAGGGFTNLFEIGSNTQATVFGLIPGATYYFAVTAYDSTGLESAFSGTISYTVPLSQPVPVVPVSLSIAANALGQAVLSGTAPVGSVYDVYAAIDLSSWLVIGTVTADATGSYEFTDEFSFLIPSRFYSLRPHAL